MAIFVHPVRDIDRQNIKIMKTVRLAFFGTPDFAVPTLRRLVSDGWPIALVVTAPDAEIGRNKKITKSPVRKVAEEFSIPVQTPEKLSSDESFFCQFSEINPDLCIVVAYGKIIPSKILSIPRLGFLNIHPSLLPKYRGASPIQSAIKDGCATTGISIMQIDAEMDHGPILSQESWTIPGGFDAKTTESELAQLGADLLARTLEPYISGKIIPQPQNHDEATFTKKFLRSDGRIDWTHKAYEIVNLVRALGVNPGTWTMWNEKMLGIFQVRAAKNPNDKKPGLVFDSSDGVAVACGNGAIVIDELQIEGKSKMSASEFIRGHPDFIGSVLERS